MTNEDSRKRVTVYLSDSEYEALERNAKAARRRPAAQAEFLLAGLLADDTEKRDE